MKELNWYSFNSKFNENPQKAFQRLSYALFCSQFNQENGIHSYKNQIGIEADPIEINGRYIGFQAKYLEPTTQISAKKSTFIESIEKAKSKNPEINEIYFFINKYFSESKKEGQKKSKCLLEIEKTARELDITIVWQVPSQIEIQLSNPINTQITREFFPELIERESVNLDLKNKEQLLEISRTAQIQIEIAKLKFNFSNKWEKNEIILDEFYAFVDFSNEIIAKDIFDFLHFRVSSRARSNMPSSIASSIHSLILTYFPSSCGKVNEALRIENGKQCVYTASNIIYDAFIYTNNYGVARWGLGIWKYIYRESKTNNYEDLFLLILNQYHRLEETLNRPERNDLDYAKELVQIFKEDLETYDLSFPPLPEHLYQLIQNSK